MNPLPLCKLEVPSLSKSSQLFVEFVNVDSRVTMRSRPLFSVGSTDIQGCLSRLHVKGLRRRGTWLGVGERCRCHVGLTLESSVHKNRRS